MGEFSLQQWRVTNGAALTRQPPLCFYVLKTSSCRSISRQPSGQHDTLWMSECVTGWVFERSVVSLGALHQWITHCSPVTARQITRGWSMRYQACCCSHCRQMSSESRCHRCLHSLHLQFEQLYKEILIMFHFFLCLIFVAPSTKRRLWGKTQDTLQRINKNEDFSSRKAHRAAAVRGSLLRVCVRH